MPTAHLRHRHDGVTAPYLVRTGLEKSRGWRYGITGYFQQDRLSRENISTCHADWNDEDG